LDNTGHRLDRGINKFNDLKDANTFYTKVLALEIITFLDVNSGSLHAVDMISLWTNMHSYYVQAGVIPQYINMMEDLQKKTETGWHTHCRCRTCHDGLGGRARSATLPP
jgi:hypothetical protein